MTGNQLVKIGEAILDEANEATEENLASSESVQAYAENAMDLIITLDHAELIRTTCLKWLGSNEQTANNYYHDVERVLESDEVKTELVIIAADTVPKATNILHLCDRLNMTQKLADDAAVKLTDHVDTSSLPTFGGPDVSEEGIYSWDECSLMRQVDGVWNCIDRGEYLIEQAYLEDEVIHERS